jgi:tetratricopeptide (TPR) repeat protein
LLPRSRILLLILLLSLLVPMGARANELLARQGVDQLLHLEFDKADQTFARLARENPDYPLVGFLKASVYWVRAEAWQGEAKKAAWREAERRLEETIAHSEQMLEKKPNDVLWRLNLGMSQFFYARVQVEMQRLFKTIRYARAGRDVLRDLIKEHPDIEDAYFVLGMYEYIAGSVPRGLKWLTYLLDISGDRELGIKYLERATARARIMAPEAARMLLAAAALQPEYAAPCKYLTLSRQMVSLYPENPHYSGANQLILVHCGYPDEALKENRRAFATYLKRFPDMTAPLNLVKLQVYPAIGAMDKIEEMAPLFAKKDYAHWYLAKAQTYDVIGERKKAKLMYREIVFAADNPDDSTVFWETPPDFVVEKAELYMQHPYRRPKPVKAAEDSLQLNDSGKPLKPMQANRSPDG